MNPQRSISWMQAQAAANALAREAAKARTAEMARIGGKHDTPSRTLLVRGHLISALTFVGGVALIAAGGAALL